MWLRDLKRGNAQAPRPECEDDPQESGRPQYEPISLTAEEQARLTQRLRELQAEPLVPVTRISPGEYTEERIAHLLAKARWTSTGKAR